MLLIQALQENQLLKMKIEQMESQSSWHSGRTPTTPMNDDRIPQGSPVSLGQPHVGAQMMDQIGYPSSQMVREIDTRTGPCPGSRLQWESQSVVQHKIGNPNAVNASIVQSFESPAQLRVPAPVPKVQGSMVGYGIYGGGEGFVDGLQGNNGQLVGVRGNEGVMLHRTVGDSTRSQELHPFPIARPPPTPVVPQIPDIPCIPKQSGRRGL